MFLVITLLFFIAIAGFIHEGLPFFTQTYYKFQKNRIEKANNELYQMFIFADKRRLVMIFAVIPFMLGAIGYFFSHNFVGFLIGVILGIFLPKVFIKQMALKRKRDFANQIVDALMILSSSLRAGMSLPQALEVVVEEMSAPIRDEFSLVVRENQMGVVLDECLAHLKQRMPVDDLELITAAIGIARETGGDLTEIFANLVFTIREKRKLEERVKTLTVQGRLQGWIMGFLPIGFAFFVYSINPRSFDAMVKDKMGQLLIVWAFVSEIIGVILIKKLSKVEV